MELSIPIPKDSRKTSFTVEECLQNYVRSCIIDKDSYYQCKRCGSRAVEHSIELLKLPNILVIHLKRFDYNKSRNKI